MCKLLPLGQCLLLWGFASVFACGCGQRASSTDRWNEILRQAKSTTDLRDHYSHFSLGGQVELHTVGVIVAAQTFPYSGVNASYLYVYRQGEDRLAFDCFIRVPSSSSVKAQMIGDEMVEFSTDEWPLAVF